MKLIIFVVTYSVLLFSCSNKSNNTTRKVCSCNLDENDMWKKYPVSSLDDSVVLCKTGKSNGVSWIEFLQNSVFYDDIDIYNCNTSESILTKYSDNSITYKNKSLIVYSKKSVPFFDPVTKGWNSIVVNFYKEIIYSEKGTIKQSKPEMILTPLKYTKQTIDEVSKEYLRKIKMPHSVSIINKLLGAALSGDSLSRQRLIHFKSQFPDDFELNFLEESIEVLNDFDTLCRTSGVITYLDNSLYSILKNYR